MHIYTRTYTHIYLYTRICMYICTCVCVCIYIDICNNGNAMFTYTCIKDSCGTRVYMYT